MDPFTNYTGMFLSNGKFQPSVAYGNKIPKTELDKFSRLHDTMYAKYDKRAKRRAADYWYYLNGPDDVESMIARHLVWYGNRALHPFDMDEWEGKVDPRDMIDIQSTVNRDPARYDPKFSVTPTPPNTPTYTNASGAQSGDSDAPHPSSYWYPLPGSGSSSFGGMPVVVAGTGARSGTGEINNDYILRQGRRIEL